VPALAWLCATIIVQTPASLTDAFEDLAKVYERQNGGVNVDLNIGASNALARQVEQGAPADVMASADQESMDYLAQRGLLSPGTRRDFAGNSLVLVAPRGGINTLRWKDLPVHPAVFRVAVGDEGVPVGRYARQVFEAVGISRALKPKLVPGPDVRTILAYVASGEVEAGVVYETDAAGSKGRVRIVDRPPPGSHEPIVYPIAVVKTSSNQVLARKWVDLVVSREGQNALKKRGFAPVAPD
jgi:molybdate transport system substrate-binding protein